MLALSTKMEEGESERPSRGDQRSLWVIKKPTACEPYNDEVVFSILMIMLLNYLPPRLNLHINIRNVEVCLLTKSFFFPPMDQGYSCKYTFHGGLYLVGEI